MDACISQVEGICNTALSTALCDVTNVMFASNAAGQVSVTYTLSVPVDTTDAQITSVFGALVTAAEGDTLITGKTVLANTVVLGASKSEL